MKVNVTKCKPGYVFDNREWPGVSITRRVPLTAPDTTESLFSCSQFPLNIVIASYLLRIPVIPAKEASIRLESLIIKIQVMISMKSGAQCQFSLALNYR